MEIIKGRFLYLGIIYDSNPNLGPDNVITSKYYPEFFRRNRVV